MPSYLIRRLLILGAIAIGGIITIQSYWVIKTLDVKEAEFSQTVEIALRKVANSIAKYNKSDLPNQNIIQRRSSNYYAVNINDVIDANVLENYLIREFENASLNTDFEYAVYDCHSQNLVYGNYCKLGDDSNEFSRSESFPPIENLEYYFVVKFPSKGGYILSTMWTSVVFSIIALLAVIFFIYAIWVIIRQRQLSVMQRDFINNMTHEFKTPISSIKIASEVILSDKNIRENTRLTQYAKIINDQNARLNHQVEKVLNIAKLEKENFQLSLEKLNLKQLLDQVVESESIKLQSSNGGKIVSVYEDEDVYVNADRVHFTNLIYNLIDNARKYTLKKPLIKVVLSRTKEGYEIRIKDNGIGIPQDQLSKIFGKFYRVPTGDRHDVKGFGLGLFYVRSVTDAHGWTIEVESKERQGTNVIIKIPNAQIIQKYG